MLTAYLINILIFLWCSLCSVCTRKIYIIELNQVYMDGVLSCILSDYLVHTTPFELFDEICMTWSMVHF